MPNKHASILIVDDDDGLRSAFAYLFTAYGFRVSEASDGFGALAKIKLEVPDILISDLNMPAMTGFELLSIVRQRFPSIGVVAMSGAYSTDAVPIGVAADAFYAKGSTSTGSLVGIVNALIEEDRSTRNRSETLIWIHDFAIESHPESAHLVWCPECLRMFSQHGKAREAEPSRARCPHCSSDIRYALLTLSGERDQLVT
jgi:DNA-binding NtrC family response regulator